MKGTLMRLLLRVAVVALVAGLGTGCSGNVEPEAAPAETVTVSAEPAPSEPSMSAREACWELFRLPEDLITGHRTSEVVTAMEDGELTPEAEGHAEELVTDLRVVADQAPVEIGSQVKTYTDEFEALLEQPEGERDASPLGEAFDALATICAVTDESPVGDFPASQTTATTRQYASIVAGNKDLAESVDEMGDCNWFGEGGLDYDRDLIACRVGIMGLEYASMGLRLELNLAGDRTSNKYIGAPPAEIATLVEDTQVTATELVKASRKVKNKDCQYDQTKRGCRTLLADAFWALGRMEDQLDRWGPYL